MSERADIGKDIRTPRAHLRKANEVGAVLSDTFNKILGRAQIIGRNVQ